MSIWQPETHTGRCPHCLDPMAEFKHHYAATMGCECQTCGKMWSGPALDEARAVTPEEAYQ